MKREVPRPASPWESPVSPGGLSPAVDASQVPRGRTGSARLHRSGRKLPHDRCRYSRRQSPSDITWRPRMHGRR